MHCEAQRTEITPALTAYYKRHRKVTIQLTETPVDLNSELTSAAKMKILERIQPLHTAV